MTRRPCWACPEYERHGDAICPECLRLYEARGYFPQSLHTLLPRVSFGRGWFSVGASHWFEASDATLFPSRDGQRLLAQAACGGICEVTIARAPHPGRECQKCLRALRKVVSQIPDERADSNGATGVSPGKLHRLYRGLKRQYEPPRVRGDRRFGTDFTDCPYTALSYATGRNGTVLVVEVPEDFPGISEELWFNPKAKRFMIRGGFDDLIVAQLAAKDLRAQVRQRGIRMASDEDKAHVLKRYIEGCRSTSSSPAIG